MRYKVAAEAELKYQAVFERLKGILQEFAPVLVLTDDSPGNYSLNGHYSQKFKKELFFGAVQIKKNYVSYHLMPVYMVPELLDGMSEPLRKRMQGKSCFNFKTVDEALLAELAELTRASYERLRKED